MIFHLKSTALPKGSKNQLATIFIAANQTADEKAFFASSSLSQLSTTAKAQINAATSHERFKGAIGQTVSVFDDATLQQIIVLGVGQIKDPALTSRALGQQISSYCKQYNIANAALLIDDAISDEEDMINHIIIGAADTNYNFEAPYDSKLKLNSKKWAADSARSLTLLLQKAPSATHKKLFSQACGIAEGIALTKHLGNLPANFATPTYLSKTAQDLGKEYGFKVQVLERKQIAALKMNSFLSVTAGSEQPPRFIIMEYKGGNAKDAPIVLVGKGITFDSGGISLKPRLGMDEMKYDMCGAASLLGTFKTLGETKPKINVVGLIATCENMPSGGATKPGDVVTSMAGLTIEILNTDAEGRLVLCDALTYAERYKPAAVVNMATLTGACVVALGHHNSALFANNEELAGELLSAGKAQRDTVWRMPLDDAYQDQLKSNFADLANIGGVPAGSITAACFLSRFTKSYPWAHLDIAGTAWKSGVAKGATGRPVALLSQFLFNRAK